MKKNFIRQLLMQFALILLCISCNQDNLFDDDPQKGSSNIRSIEEVNEIVAEFSKQNTKAQCNIKIQALSVNPKVISSMENDMSEISDTLLYYVTGIENPMLI